MRNLPKVPLTNCPPEYARLVAQGFDYWQEAFELELKPEFIESLLSAQAAAKQLSDNLDATVTYDLHGYNLQMHATGAAGGVRWRLQNDDVILLIGSPNRSWPVSVRYLSAGIWEHGIVALRDHVLHAVEPFTRRRSHDFIRVTRFDYCFDFYSPSFTRDFTPGIAEHVVCHSSAKAHLAGSFNFWSRRHHGETLTIGSKRGLQVQLYDKTLEIHEQSGKDWLYEVWADGMGSWPWEGRPKHVYRLECRFSKAFLKERNVRTPHQVMRFLQNLIGEALYTRRLATPNAGDSHADRWPMHPLWSEALRKCNPDAMLPVGRRITGRRKALLQAQLRSLAGQFRSASILEVGAYSDTKVLDLATRARALILADPRHNKKIEAARNRYRDVEEAR